MSSWFECPQCSYGTNKESLWLAHSCDKAGPDLRDAVDQAQRERLRLKTGWIRNHFEDRRLTGSRLGPDVFVDQLWTPIKWDDEEDPSWVKAAAVETQPAFAKNSKESA